MSEKRQLSITVWLWDSHFRFRWLPRLRWRDDLGVTPRDDIFRITCYWLRAGLYFATWRGLPPLEPNAIMLRLGRLRKIWRRAERKPTPHICRVHGAYDKPSAGQHATFFLKPGEKCSRCGKTNET